VILNLADKFVDIAATRCLADGQESFNYKSENSKQAAYQNGYDNSPEVHTGKSGLRSFVARPEPSAQIGFGKIAVCTN
jgi:hypothetical protein